MAVGGSEIVLFDPFGSVSGRNRSSVGEQIGVCGKCGAMVASGFETLHATWHGTAGWSQQAGMTSRQARGPMDPSSP